MSLDLYDYQEIAIGQLKPGSILCGGVGSGKSRTALAYYYLKECKGSLEINGHGKWAPMKEPKDLYIITTARKRDSLEWEKECVPFVFSKQKVKIVIDSWNKIVHYTDVENAFFIFDEQRLVGSGAWVKAFYKIVKKNRWILCTATPGDTWLDYIPVFVANGFYRNRSDFIRQHVIYSRFAKYPKVDRYVDVGRLIKLRKSILINMYYVGKNVRHNEYIRVSYDKDLYNKAWRNRWNVFKDKPCKNISEMCSVIRQITNTHSSRAERVIELVREHPRVIIFYNFDYELSILRQIGKDMGIQTAEWNGHKHMPVPEKGNWIYLVQYSAGSEAWNCTQTNTIIFYSQNYSYKIMEQSSGRIDRVNTPYPDLYYYHLVSNSPLDMAISECLAKKQDFNESKYFV